MTLEEHESFPSLCDRIGRRYGKFPHEVEEMPYDWYQKILAIMKAEEEISEIQAQHAQQKRALRGR